VTHFSECLTDGLVGSAHLGDQGNASQQDTVIVDLQERFRLRGEVVHQVGDSSDDSQSTQGGLKVSLYTYPGSIS
jgi:hypothetical protein